MTIPEDDTRGRPMHDVGALVVLLTARPVMWWLNRRPGSRETMEQIRGYARRRPTDVLSAELSNIARTYGWLFVTVAFLALYVAASLSRHLTDDRGDLVLRDAMIVAASGAMVAAGALLLCGVRWSALIAMDRRLDARPERRPQLRPVLRRLVTPSNLDLLAGVVFALIFVPLIAADIPYEV